MLRISNHTACRFAEKARFTFFKAKTLYTESADEQADGRYAARISAGRLCAFTPHAAGECVSRCLRRACKAIPENVVVYFAGERKGGTRRFPELFRLFTLRGKEPLCSAVDVRKAPASPDGHGLRPPVGSLLAAKRAPAFPQQSEERRSRSSPSNSPILPKTRALLCGRKIDILIIHKIFYFYMSLPGEYAGE